MKKNTCTAIAVSGGIDLIISKDSPSYDNFVSPMSYIQDGQAFVYYGDVEDGKGKPCMGLKIRKTTLVPKLKPGQIWYNNSTKKDYIVFNDKEGSCYWVTPLNGRGQRLVIDKNPNQYWEFRYETTKNK